VLAATLEERFRADGLTCEYRPFASARELPRDRPTIVLINYKFLIDHYIAVLGTDDTGNYIVGDPLEGRRSTMTAAELESVWRRVGIVLSRER
jgi:ABC-type bacteriocin/lantibiotic exporter with double-glycine peptidase domain